MKAVIQRVTAASVTIKETGERREIGVGLVTLLGVAIGDEERDAEWMAEKIAALRIFEDGDGKMNVSLRERNGAMLIVSQFTLLGDAKKGRRPSFARAAAPNDAKPLYERFIEKIKAAGIATATGEFGADMTVEIVNDGPVTLILES